MKINRTRSVTSLQPDTRNGHKPPIIPQFYGNKACGIRNTSCGPGNPPKQIQLPVEIKPWWKQVIPPPDPVTLKNFKPTVKMEKVVEEKKLDLDGLIMKFQERRTK